MIEIGPVIDPEEDEVFVEILSPENKQFEPWITNNWLDLNDEKKTMLYIEVSVPKIGAGTFTSVDLQISDRQGAANKGYKFVISVVEAEPEEQETPSDSDSNEIEETLAPADQEASAEPEENENNFDPRPSSS